MSLEILITVIIPCFNEEKFIENMILSLKKQTYSQNEFEAIFSDGLSTDGTREIIQRYANENSFIRLIDNPERIVPFALNKALLVAKGKIIIRMDAHSVYPDDYIEKLVFWLAKLDADNVGGIWLTRSSADTLTARAIALATSHPFGVGNAYYRTGVDNPMEVDTVPFGCYRIEIFNKIGLFDEDLIRNQDDEFNARLIKNGGRIFLIPDIKIIYYARDTFKKMYLMFYQYGNFKPLVNLKIGKPATFRQFVPLIFVASLLMSLFFSILLHLFFIVIFFLILVLYFIVNILISINISFKNEFRLLPFLIVAFFLTHISYGLGYMKGIIDFIIFKKHNKKKISIKSSR